MSYYLLSVVHAVMRLDAALANVNPNSIIHFALKEKKEDLMLHYLDLDPELRSRYDYEPTSVLSSF